LKNLKILIIYSYSDPNLYNILILINNMHAKNLTIFLSYMLNISFITIIPIISINAQIDQAPDLAKDENVTSTIKPQGTSIGAQNETSMTEDKSQITSGGNVTSTIKPQGTSIGAQNETSMTEDKSQITSGGNVTSTIKPQGTSIDNTN
jgi:hypothetical protein